MTSKRIAGKTGSLPSSFLIGTGAGILVLLIGISAGAWAVLKEWINEDTLGILALVITVLSAGIASFVSAGIAGKRKLQISLIAGVILFLILLACNAMFFEGQYTGVVRSVIAILAACTTAALLGMREERTGKKRTGKRPYR